MTTTVAPKEKEEHLVASSVSGLTQVCEGDIEGLMRARRCH